MSDATPLNPFSLRIDDASTTDLKPSSNVKITLFWGTFLFELYKVI